MKSARLPVRSNIAVVGMVLTLAFLLGIHAAGPAVRTAAASTGPPAPVEVEVLSQMRDAGKATYWVMLREQADLTPALAMGEHARGQFVFDQLQAVANRSQKGLRSLLRARGADFTPFWAANVVKVSSDKATLDAVATLPEVAQIEADRLYTIPEPIPGVQESTIQGVEWNLANIRAPEAWSTFGSRGDGIVVGSIDTGSQFNHPALVNQYRGNLGGGVFDHNYNWYDPSNICGSPSLVPCDNNNHGTHTMGTIVGDDGAGNQIGVAPAARWITAKGCESSSCSTTALVAAGQWMLAPTDLMGGNPRPDLRPHLVSNSWGDGPGDTFYRQIVQNWVAAGMFPVFANGNSGPACGTVGSPGDYPESYGVGAYDSNNVIASFSSRGASAFGVTKPNISAPGVNVRSSIPGNAYAAYSGTSMATPHVAGVVALMWSAAPSLISDVTATRAILDQTAIDTPDTSCGGAPSNNNVFGEGRMDAYAAVDVSPRGPTGILQGTVTDNSTAVLLAGMRVRVLGGTSDRTTLTDASGAYRFTLPVGSYDITVSGFGYETQTAAGVVVTEGATTSRDFAMVPAPSHPLSGTVFDTEGNGVANATVTILGTPIPPAVADANGAYLFDSVPDGTYDVKAEAGRCNDPQTQNVVLPVLSTLDFILPPRTDSFGYSCRIVPQAWIDASNVLALTGDDTYVQVALPFNFEFYGSRYSTAYVSTNGYLTFVTPSAAYANTAIPNAVEPNAAVYGLWDDLYVDALSSVRTDTVGQAGTRQFVVEWRNVAFYGDLASRVDVELALSENGEILAQYRNINAANGREQGNSATLGLENATGTVAFQYAYNEPVVSEGLAMRYAVTPFTGVEGRVTDANDGLATQGATVRALQDGNEIQRTNTDAGGFYRLYLQAGAYLIEASKSSYETTSANVNVTSGNHVAQDFALRTARAAVSPASFSFSMATGQSRTQTLTISNTGGLELHWQIAESGGDVAWLSEAPASGVVVPSGSQPVQVTANATGLARGTYSAILLLQSDSGRQPVLQVPVYVTVTQYDQAVNVGGAAYTDVYGIFWYADAAYTPGSYGYTNTTTSTVETTKKAIANTLDPTLFRSQRVNPGEYGFDVPNGTYDVTLRFAEVKQVKRGARVFDVLLESQSTCLARHDIATEVGIWAADEHTCRVTVADGVLNILFVPQPGKLPPVVNAIRVLQQQ